MNMWMRSEEGGMDGEHEEGETCREGKETGQKFSTDRRDERKAAGVKDKRIHGKVKEPWS